jgi:hypothetical protein
MEYAIHSAESEPLEKKDESWLSTEKRKGIEAVERKSLSSPFFSFLSFPKCRMK